MRIATRTVPDLRKNDLVVDQAAHRSPLRPRSRSIPSNPRQPGKALPKRLRASARREGSDKVGGDTATEAWIVFVSFNLGPHETLALFCVRGDWRQRALICRPLSASHFPEMAPEIGRAQPADGGYDAIASTTSIFDVFGPPEPWETVATQVICDLLERSA